MSYALMAIFAVLIVAADQFTKYLTVVNIAPSSSAAFIEKLCSGYSIDPESYAQLPANIPVIPKLFSLSHIHNDGGAWGMFDGAIWLFVVIVPNCFVRWEYKDA